MKMPFLLALSALVVAHSAYALDCTKASSPVDKMICATPDLKKADEDMSATYFKLLRATTDPDFHEALIRSQRKWLKERSLGPQRYGLAENDKTDDREVLLEMTRDRVKFLQGPAIRNMENQRKIASEDGGGAFAGYSSTCTLMPPPYGNWTYECGGGVTRQHGDRICSLGQEWASGHMTDYRLLSVIKDGKPHPVASCSTGYASTTEQCPEPDDPPEFKAIAHWNTTPDPANEDLPIPGADKLWKYDPDLDQDLTDQPWMHDCLFAPNFPLPELSRADPPRKK